MLRKGLLWSRDRPSLECAVPDFSGKRQAQWSPDLAKLNPKCHMNYSIIFTEINLYQETQVAQIMAISSIVILLQIIGLSQHLGDPQSIKCTTIGGFALLRLLGRRAAI